MCVFGCVLCMVLHSLGVCIVGGFGVVEIMLTCVVLGCIGERMLSKE